MASTGPYLVDIKVGVGEGRRGQPGKAPGFGAAQYESQNL